MSYTARTLKWDARYLDLARFVARWSKDPSTKVGAVLADAEQRPLAFGYNGFAQGVDDAPERYANRELKYRMIIHGEINALTFAKAQGDLKGSTLYTWPLLPCSRCSPQVIQNKIARVVAPACPEDKLGRWGDDIELSLMMLREAKVQVSEYHASELEGMFRDFCGE